MEILNYKAVVEKLLTEKPSCRENDNLIVAKIWAKHYDFKLKEISADTLCQDLASGNLPSFESISRCRRKLQEENPQLRGSNYDARQKEQDNVKQQLKQA